MRSPIFQNPAEPLFLLEKARFDLLQTLVLAELGFVDLALYMISQLEGLEKSKGDQLLRFYQRPISWVEWLTCRWTKQPAKKIRQLKDWDA